MTKTVTKKPKPLAMDLSAKAMLASLTIRIPPFAKKDKEVTEEVLTSRQAKSDAGSFNKKLISCDILKEIRKVAGDARNNVHYKLTLPWDQDGARILPAAAAAEYDRELRQRKVEFDNLVSKFLAGYEAKVTSERDRLGGLWKADDYQSMEEVRERFAWDLLIQPMPNADDFRVSLSKEMTDRVRSQIEERARKSVEEGMASLYERAAKIVTHMAESLEDYKVVINANGEEKKENAFRDSITRNVIELAQQLPMLNLTDDPRISALTGSITTKLTKHTPKELREDEAARKKVAKDARSILDDMKGFMG
jgi:hypothetical protein